MSFYKKSNTEKTSRISIFILILFGMLSVNVFAEREAKTPEESRLINIIYENQILSAKILIKQGIAIDITDKYGQSLLMIAVKNNYIKLIKLLIENGANPNYEIKKSDIPSLVGKNVLDFGVARGDTTVVDLLLDFGTRLDIANDSLNGIVADAFEKCNSEMVRYLLDKGAKISDKTGQYLVISYILNNYLIGVDGRIIIDEKTDLYLIRALDDYGIPLDEKALLNSTFITTATEKYKVNDYMSTYSQFLANEDKFKTSTEYSYTDQEHEISDSNNSSYLFFICATFLLVMLVIIFIIEDAKRGFFYTQYFYIKYIRHKMIPYSRRVYKSALDKLTNTFNKIKQFPKTIYKYSISTSKQLKSKITVFVKAKEKPTTNEENVFNHIDSSDKGWTVDDTIELDVNYLTIEDIINPIRIVNQHERLVREMIWYVRKIEKTNVDKKEACDILASKWKQVNPKQVRSIYKRSLLVILENYSQQNSRVNKLTKQVKAK